MAEVAHESHTKRAAAREAADSAAAWLKETVWPLWLECGVDWTAGAFHEHLDPDTLCCDAGFRRLRVAARQVYAFAQASALGVPRAADAVALGLHFLERHALQENGGYARCFDLAGGTIDRTLSLYDQAFTLLAFANADLRGQALALIAFIEKHFRHPDGGYVESLPPHGPRRQNTHMHLFEACLAAAERFGDPVFAEVADRLGEVVAGRFFQPSEGILPELFDRMVVPIRHDGRCIVEPGHHCEWVWLITRYAAIAACHRWRDELGAISAALIGFTDRHGIHPELGTLYDALWSDGSVRTPTSRLWPQTERLKAEALRPAPTAGRVTAAYAALTVHVDGAPPGLWREHLAADGSWTREHAPASSLYHLTCGILETRAVLAAKGW